MPKRDFNKVSSSSIFIYTGSIWPVGNSLNIVAELQPWMLVFLSTYKRSHNVSFLVDTSNLKHQDDIKCDNIERSQYVFGLGEDQPRLVIN